MSAFTLNHLFGFKTIGALYLDLHLNICIPSSLHMV